jgi:hypothetical protein
MLVILGALLAIAFACAVVASASGCGLSNTKFTWPDAVKCLPQPESVPLEVEQILATSGDVESDMEGLALKDGTSAALCAVDQFVHSIGPRSSVDEVAKARGRAFLKKAGTKVGR